MSVQQLAPGSCFPRKARGIDLFEQARFPLPELGIAWEAPGRPRLPRPLVGGPKSEISVLGLPGGRGRAV